MNPAEELKELLKRVNRTRDWLAERTGYKAGTIRQYLGGSKQSRPFFKKAREVLMAEEALQRAGRKAMPQWTLIFETEEEFQRVDRASRLVGAESFMDFCRETLLARANGILERKRRGSYRNLEPLPSPMVAEEEPEA